ncbi:MAG: hypothetical protein RLZZ609_115 [Cyanobacteriota bacterium]|jgi:hypothetical protein
MPPMNEPPNNLASLLLIVAGTISAPIGVGIILLMLGLGLLREANGEHSFPRIHGWIKFIHAVQFWRMIKL